MKVIKCQQCDFNAVVFDKHYRNWYCAGHALVSVSVLINAAKFDKCEFVAVSDFQKDTLGIWFCATCNQDNDKPVCYECGHLFLLTK